MTSLYEPASIVAKRMLGDGRDEPCPKGYIVYFIQGTRPGALVKIGVTKGDPRDRLRMLQTGSPVRLGLRAWMPGGRVMESRLHMYFGPWRKHGEWFKPTEELVEIMDGAKAWFG